MVEYIIKLYKCITFDFVLHNFLWFYVFIMHSKHILSDNQLFPKFNLNESNSYLQIFYYKEADS